MQVINGNEELAQRAWNYLNDSMRLDLSICYPTPVITCAAIYIASEDLHFALPSGLEASATNTKEGVTPAWWSVFGASLETIKKIKHAILRLYTLPKVQLTTWLVW
jgi:hypothetical protein